MLARAARRLRSVEGLRVDARWAAERYAEDAFRADMAWWELSMNHYLATGKLLRRPGPGAG